MSLFLWVRLFPLRPGKEQSELTTLDLQIIAAVYLTHIPDPAALTPSASSIAMAAMSELLAAFDKGALELTLTSHSLLLRHSLLLLVGTRSLGLLVSRLSVSLTPKRS